MRDVVTRFAPSPTGRLHVGHAYSALLAHRFARERGGMFLVRIEDIDPGRSRAEHVDAILADLEWLGISIDGEILYQSERLDAYGEALGRLQAAGLAYPCFCTRAAIAVEIAASASAPHGPAGPAYPGTCRHLDPATRNRRMASEPHAWRLDMAEAIARAGPLAWTHHGRSIAAEPAPFGDIVLARKDAPSSYHLASVVDDAAQQVTDIIRGRDLYEATHVHRLLQALLELPVPDYHHHALIGDAEGRRLAKRNGALAIASLRASGMAPEKLAEDLLADRFPAGTSLARA